MHQSEMRAKQQVLYTTLSKIIQHKSLRCAHPLRKKQEAPYIQRQMFRETSSSVFKILCYYFLCNWCSVQKVYAYPMSSSFLYFVFQWINKWDTLNMQIYLERINIFTELIIPTPEYSLSLSLSFLQIPSFEYFSFYYYCSQELYREQLESDMKFIMIVTQS